MKVIVELSFLELFVKKYKDVVLANLDTCLNKAMDQLKGGSWETIKTLKVDTFASDPENIEDAKRAIKRIYTMQCIDFSQFSSPKNGLEEYEGKLMKDLLIEIAKVDAENKRRFNDINQYKTTSIQLHYDQTLNLSLINTNGGQNSMNHINQTPRSPLDFHLTLESTHQHNHHPSQPPCPQPPLQTSKSFDLTPISKPK